MNIYEKPRCHGRQLDVKRFFVSAWMTIEAFQHARPPAVIITVLAKNAGQAQAFVKDCYAARAYDVFDASETPVECEATCTYEEWRDSRTKAG